MTRRESNKLIDVVAKQRVDADLQRPNSIAYKGCECVLYFDRIARIHDQQMQAKRADRSFQLFCLRRCHDRIGWIDQQRNRLGCRDELVQQF